jgi:hypothetical protein
MRSDSGMEGHMGDRASTNALGWQLAALLFAGATIGAFAFGIMEYRAAHSLAAQLAVATTDAKHAHEEAARLKNQLSMDAPRR